MDRRVHEWSRQPLTAIHFKKFIRDLKEDGGLSLDVFGPPTPPALGVLFMQRLVEIGVLSPVQRYVRVQRGNDTLLIQNRVSGGHEAQLAGGH